MSLFAGQTRDQLRQAYADAWRKRRDGSLLTPLEAMIADVVGLHPDFQPLIEAAPDGATRAPLSAAAVENPFLHLGLHMAVREQLSIDRPAGVRDLHAGLRIRCGDAHEAEHELMRALGEALRNAQEAARPPDEREYLDLARRRMAALAPRRGA